MRFLLFFILRSCQDCLYHKPTPNYKMDHSVCIKFNEKYIDICRQDASKCGIEAIHFTPKTTRTNTSCSTCAHYMPEEKQCSLFAIRSTLTGLSIYEQSDRCRNNDYKCGKEGKYYRPLTPK